VHGDDRLTHTFPEVEIEGVTKEKKHGDFGLGIANKHRERVFEHFYRVDTRLTREVYGLDLGLTVCQYLVALQRGRIWVESCADGGSALYLWLPLAESPTRN
jgi:signal transduction histidine kinase